MVDLAHNATLPEAPEPNPWVQHPSYPGLLRAFDATAIRSLQECPRKFQYQQIEGWRGSNVHLEWGSFYHAAVETFDKAILRGASSEDATDEAVERCLADSWLDGSTPNSRPWRGEYIRAWRCTRAEPWKRKDPDTGKQRTAICPRRKAGWFDNNPPPACPQCGAEVEVNASHWLPEDKYKNRYTLLRAVVEYCDAYDPEGPLQPYAFPDGRPAVELSFALPLPLDSPDGRPYLLTGNIDALCTFQGDLMVRERKTTKAAVGGYFFERYAPDTQIDTYDLATWLLYSSGPLPVQGTFIEVTQVGVDFCRIERQEVRVPEERREEWLRDIQVWIKAAEGYAAADYWPKNTNSCNNNGGCPFRSICRLAPSSREKFLPAKFVKQEPWNPLAVR